ncbi:unnamed protein product, partial [Mesorhabditis spiculigera]
MAATTQQRQQEGLDFFTTTCIKNYVKAFPNERTPCVKLTKLCKDQWKGMAAATKGQFVKMAGLGKPYIERPPDHRTYVRRSTRRSASSKASVWQPKTYARIKRPANPYCRFVREYCANWGNKGHHGLTAIQVCGPKWKALSPEERQPYIAEFKADLDRYNEEKRKLQSVYKRSADDCDS